MGIYSQEEYFIGEIRGGKSQNSAFPKAVMEIRRRKR